MWWLQLRFDFDSTAGQPLDVQCSMRITYGEN